MEFIFHGGTPILRISEFQEVNISNIKNSYTNNFKKNVLNGFWRENPLARNSKLTFLVAELETDSK